MTSSKKTKIVTGVFRNRAAAERVYEWLLSTGHSSADINVLVSEKGRSIYLHGDAKKPIKASSEAAEGVATGGAIGTAVGATLAALLTLGTTIAIPGVGIFAGPIFAGLAGAGAGAVAGGVIGGLVGLGIPESNAKAYEEALRDGGAVIGVAPRDSEDSKRIQKYFEEHQGENVLTI